MMVAARPGHVPLGNKFHLRIYPSLLSYAAEGFFWFNAEQRILNPASLSGTDRSSRQEIS